MSRIFIFNSYSLGLSSSLNSISAITSSASLSYSMSKSPFLTQKYAFRHESDYLLRGLARGFAWKLPIPSKTELGAFLANLRLLFFVFVELFVFLILVIEWFFGLQDLHIFVSAWNGTRGRHEVGIRKVKIFIMPFDVLLGLVSVEVLCNVRPVAESEAFLMKTGIPILPIKEVPLRPSNHLKKGGNWVCWWPCSSVRCWNRWRPLRRWSSWRTHRPRSRWRWWFWWTSWFLMIAIIPFSQWSQCTLLEG